MIKGRILKVILVLMLVILVASVGGGCGPSLAGKWEYIQDGETYFIEFFNDGQVEMGGDSIVFASTYEETGDKEITMTLVSVNGVAVEEEQEVVLEYSISGDDLTLDDGVDPVTFTRVK